MKAALNTNNTASGQALYMALELSLRTWKVGFSNGERSRFVTVPAEEPVRLLEQVRTAKEKLGLPADCPVHSCYEAGRDGFWVHRWLESHGVQNAVVDSSSIEVSRRRRRAKTDGVDVKALLALLWRYQGGDQRALKPVRVPTAVEEDYRRLHRERERLLKERGSHSARLQALLISQGIRLKPGRDFVARVKRLKTGTGSPLGPELLAELEREYERYQLVCQQVRKLEAEQQRRVEEAAEGGPEALVAQLMQLRSVGWQTSWLLVMECFGWREFGNRRELGGFAGLVPTPYSSGDLQREQGISKAGNKRLRRLMVEFAWLWLRYQPGSVLSRWYRCRYGQGSKRQRRVGIVALARKLLIALWRYLKDGVIPEGAVLSNS